jgi:hypothetical protein
MDTPQPEPPAREPGPGFDVSRPDIARGCKFWLKDLTLLTDHELRQELKLETTDTVRCRHIMNLIRQRLAVIIGEYAAEALEFPSRLSLLPDEHLAVLREWAADMSHVATCDAIVAVQCKRDDANQKAAGKAVPHT